jgi:hypothetical protein
MKEKLVLATLFVATSIAGRAALIPELIGVIHGPDPGSFRGGIW